jgi:hypothetical protein
MSLVKRLFRKSYYKTAVHELSHSLVVEHFGGKVTGLEVSCFSGYCAFEDVPDKALVKVYVAGYVAEKLLAGEEPVCPIRGGAFEGDLECIRDLGASERDIEVAVSRVQSILQAPGAFETLTSRAQTLLDQ